VSFFIHVVVGKFSQCLFDSRVFIYLSCLMAPIAMTLSDLEGQFSCLKLSYLAKYGTCSNEYSHQAELETSNVAPRLQTSGLITR